MVSSGDLEPNPGDDVDARRHSTKSWNGVEHRRHYYLSKALDPRAALSNQLK